jgi:hypothetical protein
VRLPLTGMLKLYDALLGRYMPAAFLINYRRELLHTFGGAGRWPAAWSRCRAAKRTHLPIC